VHAKYRCLTVVASFELMQSRLWSRFSQGMSLHWCMQPDVGLPRPDAVIFLSLDADAAVHRDSYGNERYENIAFQRRVAGVFKQLKSPYWEVCVVDDY